MCNNVDSDYKVFFMRHPVKFICQVLNNASICLRISFLFDINYDISTNLHKAKAPKYLYAPGEFSISTAIEIYYDYFEMNQ